MLGSFQPPYLALRLILQSRPAHHRAAGVKICRTRSIVIMLATAPASGGTCSDSWSVLVQLSRAVEQKGN